METVLQDTMTDPSDPFKSVMIDKLAEALSKAQGEMDSAKKDCFNPHFKSKYADLASVLDAIREPLARNGLAIMQNTQYHGENMVLVSRLVHKSGQWIKSEMRISNTALTPHAIGTQMSYFRRYSIVSLVCQASEEDDGNEASGVAPNGKKQQAPVQAAIPQDKIEDVIDKFIQAQQIAEGSDKMEFIGYLANKRGVSKFSMLAKVAQHSETFEKHFAKWLNEKAPQENQSNPEEAIESLEEPKSELSIPADETLSEVIL